MDGGRGVWEPAEGRERIHFGLGLSLAITLYPPFVSSDVETLRDEPVRDYEIALPPPREVFNLVYYQPRVAPFARAANFVSTFSLAKIA